MQILAALSRLAAEITREIERIAQGADPATFGEGFDLASFEFQAVIPREETMQLGLVAQAPTHAIGMLMRSLGESRGRAEETEERLHMIRKFVEQHVPESDPNRATLEQMLGGFKVD